MSFAKTAILLAGMTALFMGAGFMLGGEGGMVIALLIAVATNAFAYWNSDKMVLRMYGAQPVDPSHPLHRIVAGLAHRAQLPMPKVYVIDNDQPNAFATGRNPQNAAVAASTGLLRILNENEVAGVMAHELAHVKNRDTLIMTITATLAGALTMLAQFSLFFGRGRDNPGGMIGSIAIMIVAPLAAMVVQMAISRTREYAADAQGAHICGNPLWLANALAKLERGAQAVDNHVAEDHPATAHMFIVNPLHARKADGLFSTHPNMDNRIDRLRHMSVDQTSQMAHKGPPQANQPTGARAKPPRSALPSSKTRRPKIKGPWG